MNYIGTIRKINGRDIWGFGTAFGCIDSIPYPTSMRDVQCALIGEKEPHILHKVGEDMNESKDNINHSNASLNKDSIKNVITDTYTKTERVKNIDKSTQPYTVTYNDVTTEYTKLTIEWVDDTETSIECPTSEYSPYYGFAIAVAKKAMGNDNTMSNLADYWMNKIPKKRSAKEKVLAEKKRIAEKREAERKERFEHRKAKKLVMDRVRAYKEYEADMKIRKEAYEKYGVPEGFNIPKDNE
jgi:hypothetical protein